MINLFFALVDPNGIIRQIEEGDLGQAGSEWKLESFLQDEDRWAKQFVRQSEHIAKRSLASDEIRQGCQVGNGWIELAIEAESIMQALERVK